MAKHISSLQAGDQPESPHLSLWLPSALSPVLVMTVVRFIERHDLVAAGLSRPFTAPSGKAGTPPLLHPL